MSVEKCERRGREGRGKGTKGKERSGEALSERLLRINQESVCCAVKSTTLRDSEDRQPHLLDTLALALRLLVVRCCARWRVCHGQAIVRQHQHVCAEQFALLNFLAERKGRCA